MGHIKLYPSLSIVAYCLCTALSAVWISFSFSSISGYSVTFFLLFVAFCTFTIVQFRIKRDVFLLTRQFFGEMFILNILTLSSWLFAFLSLYKVEPSIECAIFQGSLPISVLVCDIIAKKARILSLRTLGIALIAINLIALLVVRLNIEGGVFTYTPEQIREGVALAAIGGASAGIYVFRSAKLYAIGSTTLEILCNRFFLLLLVTGAIGFKGIFDVSLADPQILTRLLLLACIAVVIPMFALQYSVEMLGASRVSIITPAIPAIALGLEHFLKGWPSVWIPILIVTTCLSLLLANYWMSKKKE